MSTNREPFSDLYEYPDSLEVYYPPGLPKWVKYLAIPFVIGFGVVFVIIGIHVYLQLFIIDHSTFSPAQANLTPTPYATPYPLPSVIYINDHDLRRLPTQSNWSCPIDRGCSSVEKIELNWRTLSVVNDETIKTRPRERKYPVWHIVESTWAGWFDRSEKHTGHWVYIKDTVYQNGDPVLICAMGGFSRGDRSLPDTHRVGETYAHQYRWCKHGRITGDKPDPPIRGEVGASVSQDFREYACTATNQTTLCEWNDLTEIVVLVVAEKYRDN